MLLGRRGADGESCRSAGGAVTSPWGEQKGARRTGWGGQQRRREPSLRPRVCSWATRVHGLGRDVGVRVHGLGHACARLGTTRQSSLGAGPATAEACHSSWERPAGLRTTAHRQPERPAAWRLRRYSGHTHTKCGTRVRPPTGSPVLAPPRAATPRHATRICFARRRPWAHAPGSHGPRPRRPEQAHV